MNTHFIINCSTGTKMSKSSFHRFFSKIKFIVLFVYVVSVCEKTKTKKKQEIDKMKMKTGGKKRFKYSSSSHAIVKWCDVVYIA